ncbi:DapH/DapD/GlmU-related protein [Shewanella seohaensis]|uniref:DapH/DapD/GlmU-related protein n=1 Tax=Shewanella seohaensis TaxID=755175 RepID=UPI0035B7D3D8
MIYSVTKSINAEDLSLALNLQLIGDKQQSILDIKALDSNESNTLTFSKKISEIKVKGIVIGLDAQKAESLIISENPRYDFCRALNFLFDHGFLTLSIPHSSIDSSASIANSACIENGVVIGANTIIEHNVVVHKGTQIGSNCIIRANTVLGAQGFGFEKGPNGSWLRFPHLGQVIIQDNVEIGALNSVCVGTIGNTVISSGVKTDNLVHIAHNCTIGKNSILTACAELSGGVTLGDNVWIGPNSSTMQKVKIGNDVMVGLASTVTKNIENGLVVAGSPARVLRSR